MQTNTHVFGFVGASGSGKSTLLNYISKKYEIDCQEISPRIFFEKDKGSYDIQNTDIIQSKIVLHNIGMTHRMIEQSILENKNIAVSRTPIDVLAYCKVLGKSIQMESLLKDEILYLKSLKNYVFVYNPIGFDLPNSSDSIRGNNKELREKTNQIIFDIIWKNKIKYKTVYGELPTRKERIDEIMKEFDVSLKKL